MATVPFQASSINADLRASPIVPAWIVAGNPVARATELMRSADLSASTVIWECTAGTFDWTYHCDETIHILEGSIVLSDAGNPPRRLGPGDVVFFPKGSQVRWEVEGYVKKIAFFRSVVPNPLTGVYKVLRKIKRALKSSPKAEASPANRGGFGRAATTGAGLPQA